MAITVNGMMNDLFNKLIKSTSLLDYQVYNNIFKIIKSNNLEINGFTFNNAFKNYLFNNNIIEAALNNNKDQITISNDFNNSLYNIVQRLDLILQNDENYKKSNKEMKNIILNENFILLITKSSLFEICLAIDKNKYKSQMAWKEV